MFIPNVGATAQGTHMNMPQLSAIGSSDPSTRHGYHAANCTGTPQLRSYGTTLNKLMLKSPMRTWMLCCLSLSTSHGQNSSLFLRKPLFFVCHLNLEMDDNYPQLFAHVSNILFQHDFGHQGASVRLHAFLPFVFTFVVALVLALPQEQLHAIRNCGSHSQKDTRFFISPQGPIIVASSP